MIRPKPWKQLVSEVIDELPPKFTLADMLARRSTFQQTYPENRNIDAKIRQTLQILRDQKLIAFHGFGHYERLEKRSPIHFSPKIDMSLASGYRSRSQIDRVVLETWAELNLYCVNCLSDDLARLPNGTPVADFVCDVCHEAYQVKAKDGRFGDRIQGAAYGVTLDACQNKAMPNHVLIEFDSRMKSVIFVDVINGKLIDELRVIPRKPLAATAKRAGWQGCTIDVRDIPKVSIVAPAGVERGYVRRVWGMHNTD